MGVVNNYKVIWNYDNDESKRRIDVGLTPTKEFWEFLRFKKARQKFSCLKCNNIYPSRTMYIGKNYEQVCFNCAGEYLENSKGFVNDINKNIKDNLEELEKNKEKWKNDLILNSL